MRSATCLISIVLLSGALGGCSEGPAAPDALGPFAVGHSSSTLVDAARGDRSLLLDVWYPVDAVHDGEFRRTSYPLQPPLGLDSEVAMEGAPAAEGSAPLVVFSHGYGSIHTQSVELLEALASHGFVVASVEHTGNAQSSLTDSFDEAAANRVPDVSFVIDTMLNRDADAEDPLFERIDETQVGVIGHSFGGMTSIGMAAGWAGASADPRVTAIVPISAVIDGDLQEDMRTGPNAGFTAEQLAEITVPVMLMGGTEDINVPVANNMIGFDQMTNAPTVYKVDIIGANHTHFSNVCAIGDLLIDSLGIGPAGWPAIGAEDLVEPYQSTCTEDVFPIEEVTRLQNLYAVAFFKRHLMDEQGYAPYLTQEHADSEPAATLISRP